MPKKQKIDKRLNQLFKDIQPEEAPPKRKPARASQEALPEVPAPIASPRPTPQPAPVPPEPISRPVTVRRSAALPVMGPARIEAVEGATSRLALTFQAGQQDWATLQVVDEAGTRTWSQDEQLLVKQVTDQLALALENARLFQETQRALETTKYRADIENLINDIATEFLNLDDPQSIDAVINRNLGRIGSYVQIDRCYLFLFSADYSKMSNTHVWCAEGIRPYITERQDVRVQAFPYLVQHIRSGHTFYVSNLRDLPEEAASEKQAFEREGIQSILRVPVTQQNRVAGFLGFDSVRAQREWNEDDVITLRLFGQIIISALDRAQSQEALTKSEADLRALFAAMEDVVLVVDKDARYLRIAPTNPSRLVRPPEELLGRLMEEFIEPETTARFKAAILETLQTGRTSQIEYELPVAGEKYWFLASLSKLDEDKVFWVARDITERKKAEENLARFKLGIENSGDAVFMTDIKGEIIFANPAFEKVYGYKPEEVIGQTPRLIKSGLIPVEQYKHFWDTLLSRQTVSGDIVNRAKDGRLVSVAGTNSPILDDKGNILGFLATHHDITGLKQAEEALQRRNTYLSVSAEIGRVITSTLDLSTIFSRAVNLISERFGFYHAAIFIVEETGFKAILREATGEAGAEMLRRKHSLPVDSESVVGKVTAQGDPVVVNNTDLKSIHRKNPLLPNTKAEAAIPLRIGNRIIGALDIQSTQVDAFAEDEIGVLQTLADQIAVAIDNARSFELSQQAVMEMREIDRLKSQFLANMSHELRTPLNSIIGFSRVILKGIDGPVTELQQQDLTAIYNSGQHLLGLINNILDLAKIEAGKMELAFDEVNMADVTNSVLSTMTGLIKDKPITIRRIIQPDLPVIRADAIRIRQVMINLLSNAAKFTDEGEIVVDVAAKTGPGSRPEILVSVTDTGPGIAQEDLSKLFQPFSQVDDSPTRKTGGTGLGLSICQQLIQMHGGRIGVHSEVGKGSTFYFTLPLYRKDKDAEAAGSGGKVILAIDDDPQVIGLYERYLQPQGYQVISLTDPSRAVERVRQLKPFAVTLDIMMPGIDGWQVLNSLKSDTETRDIPVIICSIIEDQEKGFSLGAADYLVKPILEEDLVGALDRLNADGSIREVLVIDDDPDDLRLIGKMLTDNGQYKPVLALGGLKGWEIIASKTPPDAVILDLFMPDLDGFRILESMRADKKLREIPVVVLSGMQLTSEQHKQLEDFGQRLLTKGAFSENELFTTIQNSLQRVPNK